jgi:hypothetical protein
MHWRGWELDKYGLEASAVGIISFSHSWETAESGYEDGTESLSSSR